MEVDFNACSPAEKAQMILRAAAKARGERAVQRPPKRPAVDFNDAQSLADAIVAAGRKARGQLDD